MTETEILETVARRSAPWKLYGSAPTQSAASQHAIWRFVAMAKSLVMKLRVKTSATTAIRLVLMDAVLLVKSNVVFSAEVGMLKGLIHVRLSVAMDSLQEMRLVTTATCLPEMDAVPRALCRKVSRVQGQYVDCRDARAGYAEMAKSLLAKKALQPGIAMTEIFSQTMAVIPLAA